MPAQAKMIPVTTGYENAQEADLVTALYDGRCVGGDPDVFFPEDDGRCAAAREAALQVCRGCPVRRQCLELTLRGPNVTGVRAGTTGIERRGMHIYRNAVRGEHRASYRYLVNVGAR